MLDEFKEDAAIGPNTTAVLDAAAAFSAPVGACPNAGTPKASIATRNVSIPHQVLERLNVRMRRLLRASPPARTKVRTANARWHTVLAAGRTSIPAPSGQATAGVVRCSMNW